MKRKATLIRIIGYLMQHKIQLFTVLALSLTSNLLALAGAVFGAVYTTPASTWRSMPRTA